LKFGRGRNQRTRELVLDMTAMIDIVFQLLIFFLTTAQLAAISRADIRLPGQRGEEDPERARSGLVVNVDASGRFVTPEGEMDAAALERSAREAVARGGAEAVRPLVRADRAAPAAKLNEALHALRKGGVAQVRLAVAPGGGT
jgi:biopolymer transport protein ExbD